MRFLKAWRVRKPETDEETVYVSEKFGVRQLHIGSDTVQSAMRIARPYDLEVAYTRCMMGFLLFREPPPSVLLVGLGGGSLAKFLHRQFPDTRVTAVEINPQVVTIARHCFLLPPNDERLEVVVAEAAQYVGEATRTWDVVMVDGYGAEAQAEEVATLKFYRDCRARLKPGGVLVVNLWGDDRAFHDCLRLIGEAFGGRAVCLPDGKAGNVIVFAQPGGAGAPDWRTLTERARALDAQFDLGFAGFVTRLAKMNPHDAERLQA
ncbi:MAG: fused MFS/spermidine synthase [Burkholderiales bacterium]